MQHIEDIQYRGHEIVIAQDADGTYVVDIREDNFSGSFAGGYTGIDTLEDAKLLGKVFVDGMREAARKIQHEIQGAFGV